MASVQHRALWIHTLRTEPWGQGKNKKNYSIAFSRLSRVESMTLPRAITLWTRVIRANREAVSSIVKGWTPLQNINTDLHTSRRRRCAQKETTNFSWARWLRFELWLYYVRSMTHNQQSTFGSSDEQPSSNRIFPSFAGRQRINLLLLNSYGRWPSMISQPINPSWVFSGMPGNNILSKAR